MLDSLTKRNKELKPIVFKSFKTDKELDRYEKKHQKLFDEYFDNKNKIDEFEWELMTPEERAIEEEQMKLYKLKQDGKLGV